MKRYAVAVLLVYACVGCSQVNEETHAAAARELIELSDPFGETWSEEINTIFENLITPDSSVYPHREMFLEFVQEKLTEDYITDLLVALYTEYFTEAELRQQIAFYKQLDSKHPEMVAAITEFFNDTIRSDLEELFEQLPKSQSAD